MGTKLLDQTTLHVVVDMLDALPFYAMLVDEDHRIIGANQVVRAYLGKPSIELSGCHCPKLIHGTDGPFAGCPVESCIAKKTPVETDMYDDRFDLWMRAAAYPTDYHTASEKRVFLHFSQDISEQKRASQESAMLKQQLAQSQKLEAIGRLAGGLAHDFNNMLTVILNLAAIVGAQVPGELNEDMREIERAAQRAAGLTQKLLTFCRKRGPAHAVLDLNATLVDLGKLLDTLLGSQIELKICPAPDVCRVKADPGQIEQAIVNLAMNARDAMPDGGTLTVSTRDVVLHEPDALIGLGVGRYATLEVQDTGVGMSSEVREHIFDPFFTTKAVGRGTGLGLSTVYGMVKQAGGGISVTSRPRTGSCFTLYLPATDESPALRSAEIELPIVPTPNRTVLIVEDDDVVLRLAARILQTNGYRTLTALSGQAALDLAASFPDPIDLLLTDVVMPGLSGTELADRLTLARAETTVMFMSGYAGQILLPLKHQSSPFIGKPFRADELAAAAARTLAKAERERQGTTPLLPGR